MVCFSPFLTTSDNGRVVGFPCGHCASCRRKKAAEWAMRIALESRMYQDLAFVTLTYDREHLPSNGSLVPSHLSSFVKRFRTYLVREGFQGRIRFYGCGEYGEKRKRPHYHIVFFGLSRRFFPLLTKAWKFGIIDAQIPRNDETVASYVGGYVTKKMRVGFYTKRGLVAPFSRQSQGIGWTFIRTLPVYTPVLKFGQHLRYLGRYLRNKLAEKFGVLKQVKEAGIRELEDTFAGFREKHTPHIPYWWNPRKHKNLADEFLFVWRSVYDGDIQLLRSRNLLYARADL